MTGQTGENALLMSRLGDAMDKRERGEIVSLPFLTPRERKQAERSLVGCGLMGAAWFWGGYASSERTCLYLLPDYLLSCLAEERVPREGEETGEICDLLAETLDETVSVLRIKGSGYRTLTHRDYLGAILSLGLERDALGDIAVQNEHEAVIFCPRTIAAFLRENLTRVASDAVKVLPWTLDESFTDGKSYRPISDTVASARLDCVVAALTDLSREDAQRAVRTGLVEVDFEEEERVDRVLTPPATLSVRGYGRYILRSFDGETRKGRLRLRADQLI